MRLITTFVGLYRSPSSINEQALAGSLYLKTVGNLSGTQNPSAAVDTSTVCQTFYAFTAPRLPDSTLKIRKVQVPASALLLF